MAMDLEAKRTNPVPELEHPNSPIVSDAGICSRCSEIDFQALFAAPRWEPLLILGPLDQELAQSSCSICRLFLSVKTICSCPEQPPTYILFSTYMLRRSGTMLNVGCLTCAQRIGDQLWAEYAIAIADNDDARFGRLIHPGCAPQASKIDPSRVDYQYLSSWLQRCEREHTKTCGSSVDGAAFPRNLKLIDCHKRQVVQAKAGCRYAALSYVWGNVKTAGLAGKAGCNQCPFTLPARLPLTIEDAITVTKKLGLGYIWIDRYCIDQDSTETHVQIKQMNLIYKKAHFTIVAAAGSDSSFGLPGVSSTPRIAQPMARSRGMQLLGIRAISGGVVASSYWNTRGWTFQEGYFSNRRLIFTPEYVYFECGSASSSEDIPEIWNDKEWPMFFPSRCGRTHMSWQSGHSWNIEGALSYYSGRSLTFSEDAINAFEGVINDYRIGEHSITHYKGLFIMPSLKLGDSGFMEPADRTASEKLISGLCWRSLGGGRRRVEFPSWSWAGWGCKISGFHPELACGLKPGPEPESLPTVAIESPAGSLIQLKDVASENGWQEAEDDILQIDAWTIPLELYKSDAPNFKLNLHFLSNRKESKKAMVLLMLRGDKQSYLLDTEFLPYLGDPAFAGQELPHAHGCDTYRGVILNWGLETLPFILIVEKNGDSYRRVGHIDAGDRYATATFAFTGETDKMRGLWEETKVFDEGLHRLLLKHKERQVLRLV